jgi:hypothetical protein
MGIKLPKIKLPKIPAPKPLKLPKEVTNTFRDIGQSAKKIIMTPTNMMASLTSKATGMMSSPYFMPAIACVGGIIILNTLKK